MTHTRMLGIGWLVGSLGVAACGTSTSNSPATSATGAPPGDGGASTSTTTTARDGGPPSSTTASDAGTRATDGAVVTTSGCQAQCSGKSCGDDGCGGTCGACPPSQLCAASGACQAPSGASTIVVDAKSQLTAIAPAIYGVALNNDDSVSLAGVNRWGGDATGSYNWKTDTFNSGSDYNCANYTGLFSAPSSAAGGSNSDEFVRFDASKHVDTLMTIPITGWLANQQTSTTSLSACAGGTVDATCCAKIGASESVQVDKGSANLDTSYMQDWVSHLVSTFGAASAGGVKYYQLDNEPDNWQALRTDIYPSLYPPGTFCEPFYTTISQVGASINQDFINRTMAYSAAVKAADPSAQVLFMSTEDPKDLVSLNGVECAGSGSPYTATASLTQAILTLAAQHDASAHERLLDCVDMHYPANGSGLNATSTIYDATAASGFPSIQGWINGTYPGTGICVSEYNWPNDGTSGAAPDTTTAALEADILGTFGRFGVRLAAYWTTLVYKTTHLPVYNAMAMYRDYDGKGGQFGSTSIGAASSNSGVHVFAASDSPTSPTTLWVMLVNVSGKDQGGLTIGVQNFTPSTAKVFQMTNGAAPAAAADATISGGAVTGVALPNGTVKLLVLTP